ELEERRLCPVDVVEDEEERPLARERLAEAAEQERDLGSGRGSLGVERSEDRALLVALRSGEDDLAERPVRDSLAVREAAAEERGDVLRAGGDLRGEPRLPDSRRADDGHDARTLLGLRGAKRLPKRAELLPAAGERSRQAA